MANIIIKWGIKITTKQKPMGLRNVCKAEVGSTRTDAL